LGDELTTKDDVIQNFRSHPMAKKELPEGLEDEWFNSAVAQYELEIDDLDYDTSISKFSSKLSFSVVYTLGLLMYIEYLTRELSRLEKINGFRGKDIQLTGSDGSKNTTYKDLCTEIERVQQILHKQKKHAFN
jgi:hypothetical protein